MWVTRDPGRVLHTVTVEMWDREQILIQKREAAFKEVISRPLYLLT